ncbi:MAG: hypothetical protein JNM76_08735 [Betaproteobacteria bacterium]|nr:hypothetical protein [Betaproteobacteria bacterium]
MIVTAEEFRIMKLLVIKDWQIYQKQLAAYVVGLIIGLTLVGMSKVWSFYGGGLLLLVLLICVGGFAIQSSLLNERKEQTLPFVMSMPVTPMMHYWSKLISNVTIYLAPFTLVVAGTAFVVLYTPIPDGVLVWAILIYGFLAVNFFLSLCTALVVESEGWNIFAQIGLSTLISPFMLAIGSIDAIHSQTRTNNVAWGSAAVAILALEIAVIVLAIVITGAIHRRKVSFL